MIDDDKLELLRSGDVQRWNATRQESSAWLDLEGADLSHVQLPGVDLSHANLRRAWLFGAHLDAADLEGAVLDHASLPGARLMSANLRSASLRDVRADGALFSDACLQHADLTGAVLLSAVLEDADVRHADLARSQAWHAEFGGARLDGANLSGFETRSEAKLTATPTGADLSHADLREASFVRADLRAAILNAADLTSTDMTAANLTGAQMVGCILEGAVLDGATIYGTNVWDATGDPDSQRGLVLARPGGDSLEVDDLRVAHLLNLLLDNPRIADVLETTTRRMVLLLGRFDDDGNEVLEAVKHRLRDLGYVAVVLNVDGPRTRDPRQTVEILARMSRFVIADLTNASSVLFEIGLLMAPMPVPIAPIIRRGDEPFSMITTLHDRATPLHTYDSTNDLVDALQTEVVEPAEAHARRLLGTSVDSSAPD